jgi:hypothetical protein
MRTLLFPAMAAMVALSLSSCLTQRTVKEGGQTVSKELVIKRPIKEAIENSQ